MADMMTLKRIPYAPAWLREEQQDALANDPRIAMASMMTKEIDAQKATKVSALNGPAVRKFVAISNAAMMADDAFLDYARKLPRKKAKELREFRPGWRQAIDKIATTKARVERFNELSKKWFAERQIELGDDGIMHFVQGLTPEEWHVFICGIEWEFDGEPDILSAAEWILQQDACDRSTAVAFLASAHAGGINAQHHYHYNEEHAASLISEVMARLEKDAYSCTDFALPKNLADHLERLEMAMKSSGSRIPWSNLKRSGARTARADFFLVHNRPAVVFERWLDETGRSLA